MQQIKLKEEKQNFRMKEAFKTLRTNIEFSGTDVKAICVTSCTPGEGKSSISLELAKSFAQNDKKVLLLDADLRKSKMRSKLKSGAVKMGMTNALAGKAGFQECLCQTNVEGLYMMLSGPVPPNPSELLGNYRFKALIEESKKVFDMIIIDTPPLGSVIDTAIVSKQCDGAVIVISAGEISYHFARKVKEQLEVADCRILGCVLNKVNMISNNGYYGKYYGRYYGKYYGNYGTEEEQ